MDYLTAHYQEADFSNLVDLWEIRAVAIGLLLLSLALSFWKRYENVLFIHLFILLSGLMFTVLWRESQAPSNETEYYFFGTIHSFSYFVALRVPFFIIIMISLVTIAAHTLWVKFLMTNVIDLITCTILLALMGYLTEMQSRKHYVILQHCLPAQIIKKKLTMSRRPSVQIGVSMPTLTKLSTPTPSSKRRNSAAPNIPRYALVSLYHLT